MFIKDLTNLGDIVTVINSIEKTLSFSSFKLFRNAITLLDFDLDRGTFGDGFQYHCSGAMGGYSISLNFYEIDKRIKLLHKIYSTPERDIQIKEDSSMHMQGTQTHRENDLPAVIEYSDNGEVCRKVYYKDGKEFRDNDSPVYIATTIEEDNIEKVYYRYYPAFEYNHENYTLYNISIFNGDVVDADFCYNNELIHITKITEVLPIIQSFDLTKLRKLKSLLSKEDLSLLDMALI